MAADLPGRRLHPIYNVVSEIENAWARDRGQQWQRTEIMVRGLVDAGMVTDGELIGGKYYCRSGDEAPR